MSRGQGNKSDVVLYELKILFNKFTIFTTSELGLTAPPKFCVQCLQSILSVYLIIYTNIQLSTFNHPQEIRYHSSLYKLQVYRRKHIVMYTTDHSINQLTEWSVVYIWGKLCNSFFPCSISFGVSISQHHLENDCVKLKGIALKILKSYMFSIKTLLYVKKKHVFNF